MKDYSLETEKIKQNLSRVRDIEIRRKASLLLGIMSARSIRLGCRLHGVCPKTFYDWRKKLRASGCDLKALRNRPRGPRISPRRTGQETAKQLCEIRKETGCAGGLVVSHIYHKRTGKKIAHSTVDNIFAREGLSSKYRPKKTNPHTKRYASQKALDRVQMDTVGLKIEDDNGNKVFAVTGIDCCSRLAFVHCCLKKSAGEARIGLLKLLKVFSKPRLIQTDNGVEFTYLFISRSNAKRIKEERYAPFEKILEQEGIEHYLIKPRTPAHNGKVERFHRSLLRYARSQELNGKDLDLIKSSIEKFVKFYNEEKPHTSLKGLTPYQLFHDHTSHKVA